jgi:hypothetical protein
MPASRRRPLAPVQSRQEERDAKRVKRTAQTAVIAGAVKELYKLRAANGGKSKQGDIQSIVNRYKKINCEFVTRSTICYAISNKKKDEKPAALINMEHQTNISPVTDPNTEPGVVAIGPKKVVVVQIVQEVAIPVNCGGRKKGSTDKAKSAKKCTTVKATTEAATEYKKLQFEAKEKGEYLPAGTLDSIIKRTEEENGLEKGTKLGYQQV